jgi:prepilin-type N-terminal cleavage/methylation domain-containing protein
LVTTQNIQQLAFDGAANLKGNTNMYQRIKASRKNESGFTLIELLIVVVILGILAAVVIFASAGFKNKGAAESCKTTVASVKTAAEAFHVDSLTASFPAKWDDLTVGATAYFEMNGISVVPVTGTNDGSVGKPVYIRGKGWDFKWESGYTPAAVGPPAVVAVNNPPAFSAGSGTAVPAGGGCTTL